MTDRSVVPGMPARKRRGHVEAVRDREWLVWISRFRFVTVAELAMRFGVSPQQARQRVRRLREARLVACVRDHQDQAAAIYLTPHGIATLGLRRRLKPPRTNLHRTHELAIAAFVAELEIRAPGLKVLTERECRLAELDGEGRFSIPVVGRGRHAKHWPDAVVLATIGPVAIEFEFTLKSKQRLRHIVRGYLASRHIAEVRYLVTTPLLARRIRQLAPPARPSGLPRHDRLTNIIVEPWHLVDAKTRQAITDAR